jgi:Uncharacterized protein conserved in bacteria (DUF2252)
MSNWPVRSRGPLPGASNVTKIFLGWTRGDMKGSALVEAMQPFGLTAYARICAWTLARAHARSGDPIAISEYLGDDDAFDQSITDFSERYADQNERDFQEFVDAVRSGRIEALKGVWRKGIGTVKDPAYGADP